MGFPFAAGVHPRNIQADVDVVPTLYIITSDSALALITGKGRTLKKYTIEKDLEARKAGCILEIGHEMLWGKDLQALVKANIAKVKELLDKYREQYGSQIRVISIVLWSGNELCGQHGIEPLDMWGQRDPQGYWPDLMERVKSNMFWWNKAAARPWCGSGRLNWRARPTCVRIGEDLHHFSGQVQGMVPCRDRQDQRPHSLDRQQQVASQVGIEDLFMRLKVKKTVQK